MWNILLQPVFVKPPTGLRSKALLHISKISFANLIFPFTHNYNFIEDIHATQSAHRQAEYINEAECFVFKQKTPGSFEISSEHDKSIEWINENFEFSRPIKCRIYRLQLISHLAEIISGNQCGIDTGCERLAVTNPFSQFSKFTPAAASMVWSRSRVEIALFRNQLSKAE